MYVPTRRATAQQAEPLYGAWADTETRAFFYQATVAMNISAVAMELAPPVPPARPPVSAALRPAGAPETASTAWLDAGAGILAWNLTTLAAAAPGQALVLTLRAARDGTPAALAAADRQPFAGNLTLCVQDACFDAVAHALPHAWARGADGVWARLAAAGRAPEVVDHVRPLTMGVIVACAAASVLLFAAALALWAHAYVHARLLKPVPRRPLWSPARSASSLFTPTPSASDRTRATSDSVSSYDTEDTSSVPAALVAPPAEAFPGPVDEPTPAPLPEIAPPVPPASDAAAPSPARVPPSSPVRAFGVGIVQLASASASLVSSALRFEHVARRSLSEDDEDDAGTRAQRFITAQDQMLSFFAKRGAPP